MAAIGTMSRDGGGIGMSRWRGGASRPPSTNHILRENVMKMETPADACAAIAVLVAGADGIGTTQESRFLFETVAALPVFGDLDRSGMSELLASAAEWVWSERDPEGGVRAKDLGEITDHIARALAPDLRADALKAAVGLARADGMSPEERDLLDRLRLGLAVDEDTPGLGGFGHSA
jgi:tellurite resistance protein